MKLHENVPASHQQIALWGSAFAFTVCFAVWTIFSIIGIQIIDGILDRIEGFIGIQVMDRSVSSPSQNGLSVDDRHIDGRKWCIR